MKKLVFTLSRLNLKGGQERSTLEVLTRLERRGWEIHIISYVFEDIPAGYSFRWHRVPAFFLPTHWLRDFWLGFYSSCLLIWKFPKQEFLSVTIGIGTWRADVRVIQFYHSRLRELVQEKKAQFPNAQSWLRLSYQRFYSLWNSRLEARLFARTQFFVAISQSVANDLVRIGRVPASKIIVINHSAESAVSVTDQLDSGGPTLDEIAAGGIQKKGLQILFVGALERKGIDKALRILALAKDLNWEFQVVGDGDLNHWRRSAADLGLSQRVHFHGAQASKSFFEKADIFLFPSLYEPFGLVITEAISHGLAVLASSECGALELWPDRPFELHLSSGAEDKAWARALRKLVQDREFRQNCVQQSQKQVSLWNWDMAAEKYDQAWRKL